MQNVSFIEKCLMCFIYLQRQEFEEDKAKFVQQQFLRITPFNNKKQGNFRSIQIVSDILTGYDIGNGSDNLLLSNISLICSHLNCSDVSHTERLVQVMPRMSPTPWHSKKSPSTAELYRTLGLVPPNERQQP